MSDDKARFERLFSEHADAVHRFAVRRGAAAIADEVVSGTFLVAWRRLADLPRDAERRWLIATARWVMTSELRTQIRQRRLAARLAAEPNQHGSDTAETSQPLIWSGPHWPLCAPAIKKYSGSPNGTRWRPLTAPTSWAAARQPSRSACTGRGDDSPPRW